MNTQFRMSLFIRVSIPRVLIPSISISSIHTPSVPIPRESKFLTSL